MGTSDRVVGRPRTGCVARVFYCERSHSQLVNAIFANICSMVIHTFPRPAEPGRIARGCPAYLRFQNVPNRRSDSGYNSYRKRRTPRIVLRSAGDQFPTLLNARASNPGHSYLRLLRRKCLLPSAPRVRLRTLNRTSYESRNAMTDESASDGGGCLRCPKRTGQTPARSLPRKEIG